MNLRETKSAIQKCLKTRRWIVRFTNDGVSPSEDADGFRWPEVGEWITAPDWNSRPVCGGGFHGQGPEAGGFCMPASRLDFCETGPERVIVEGNKVKVKKARILCHYLPEGLRFKGSFCLYETKITELPKGLRVDGSLYLSDTKITKLPKRLYVSGSLNLSNTQITKLPKDLHVGGSLDLFGTKIIELPKGLRVGGSLDLRNTKITKLPKGLYVGGSLYLRGTKITKLPENLYVGGEQVYQ